MTHWNYRLLYHEDRDQLQVHEVYYTDKNPDAWIEAEKAPIGDSIEEVNDVLTMMSGALKRPILYAGDRFPEVYSIGYSDSVKVC